MDDSGEKGRRKRRRGGDEQKCYRDDGRGGGMILISVGEGGPGVAGWRARDNRRWKCLSEGKLLFGGGN